jgi:glycerol transport system ATP-binding protein
VKSGAQIMLGDVKAPVMGAMADVPDGTYRAGFRANHLTLTRQSAAAVSFPCFVFVSEITGSESFLHLQHGDDRWVGLVHGVEDLAPGTTVNVWLDPAHVYLFGQDGRLVAPAPYAMAA